MDPFCFRPVAWPVSPSNSRYSSAVYLASRVMLALPRSWPISPAACQVVPEVSLRRSSSTTSVMLILVR